MILTTFEIWLAVSLSHIKTRSQVLPGVAGVAALAPLVASARPEGVNKPELLPPKCARGATPLSSGTNRNTRDLQTREREKRERQRDENICVDARARARDDDLDVRFSLLNQRRAALATSLTRPECLSQASGRLGADGGGRGGELPHERRAKAIGEHHRQTRAPRRVLVAVFRERRSEERTEKKHRGARPSSRVRVALSPRRLRFHTRGCFVQTPKGRALCAFGRDTSPGSRIRPRVPKPDSETRVSRGSLAGVSQRVSLESPLQVADSDDVF